MASPAVASPAAPALGPHPGAAQLLFAVVASEARVVRLHEIIALVLGDGRQVLLPNVREDKGSACGREDVGRWVGENGERLSLGLHIHWLVDSKRERDILRKIRGQWKRSKRESTVEDVKERPKT